VQEDFQTVLRAVGKTETTQENIQDWLELDEGDPGFQRLTKEEISAVKRLFPSTLHILLNFPFICFLSFFRATFYFINPDWREFTVPVFLKLWSADYQWSGAEWKSLTRHVVTEGTDQNLRPLDNWSY
jgi:hypothetical protein